MAQIMMKHIQNVKDVVSSRKDITRDMFIHECDVRNLGRIIARETHMMHKSIAMSVKLWVHANHKDVFFY